MAITRITQEGFELFGSNWADQWNWIPLGTKPTVSGSGKATGNYGASIGSITLGAYYKIDSAISQMRSALYAVLTTGAGTANSLFWLGTDGISNLALHLWYNDSTGLWTLDAGATTLGSFTLDIADSTWRHWGIDFKIDASSGWAYVYVDGVAKISYTGQTNQGASTFDSIGLGPISTSYDGWNVLFLDDFYVDESTGETSPSPVALRRFYPLIANASGNYSQWYGGDGDQTSNYLESNSVGYITGMITNFVESGTSGHRDSYALQNSSTHPDLATATIDAVIPTYYLRTRSISDSITVTPFLRYSSTNDDGTSVTPPVYNTTTWERFTLDPLGASWTTTAIDGLEVGILFD